MRLRYLPLAESEFNSNVILERVICFRMTAAKNSCIQNGQQNYLRGIEIKYLSEFQVHISTKQL
jgi:hypothetical protein